MDVYAWFAFPNHYYLGIFRSLAEIWQGEVHVIFEHSSNNLYKGLDLQLPEFGNLITHFSDQMNDFASWSKTIIYEHTNAIHIYYTLNSFSPFFQSCIPILIQNNIKFIFMSERPRQHTFFMAVAREILYRYRLAKYKNKCAAILALGNLGCTAFQRFGFNKTKIFPMLYCVDQPNFPSPQQIKSDSIHFIHLAGLQEHYRKGLDIIFKAFSQLKNLNWHCSILGFDVTLKLKKQLHSYQIEDKIHLLGKCKNTDVFNYISQNDVLLLPSRHDGWGVALAEGIYSGIAGIASDNVGSKDLIEGFQCGRIVKAGSVSSLADALQYCIKNRSAIEQWKSNAIKHRHLLTPDNVAKYLAEILEYVFVKNFKGNRPNIPWENLENNI
jgi:glycosyltransferase involved in cell wall biosynthesis